jgi:hypothetical protein
MLTSRWGLSDVGQRMWRVVIPHGKRIVDQVVRQVKPSIAGNFSQQLVFRGAYEYLKVMVDRRATNRRKPMSRLNRLPPGRGLRCHKLLKQAAPSRELEGAFGDMEMLGELGGGGEEEVSRGMEPSLR